MARLMAAADGNFTSSGTWVTVDAATALVTEGGVSRTALTTSSQNSANITPTSAITIDAIAIKLADVQGATGNLTLTLYNVTTTASVVSLTIPIADLPQGTANTTGLRGGWVLFATGDQNLSSGSNYQVRLNVSSGSSTVGVLTNGTTANWQHMFRTKTAAAPSAGDDLFVLGLWTSSGTWTQYAVTMDSTSSATTYGSNPGAATPQERSGLIVAKASLAFGTTASTAYALKVAGSVTAGPGGTISIGTVGTPMPDTSTGTLILATTAGYGVFVGVSGTLYCHGSPRTSGKAVNWCHLTGDMTSGSTTTASVDKDTGWLNGDTVYVGTSRPGTSSDAAEYTLSGNASTASMVFSGAVSANYLGASPFPFPAPVVLTKYNVEITSDSSSRIMTWGVYSGTFTMTWTKFTYMGQGIINAVTSNLTWRYCCFSHGNQSGVQNLTFSGAISGTWSLRDLVWITGQNAATLAWSQGATSVFTNFTFADWILIHDAGSGGASCNFDYQDQAITGIRLYGGNAGCTLTCLDNTIAATANLLTDSVFYTNAAAGLSIGDVAAHTTFTNVKVAGATQAINDGGTKWDITFENCVLVSDGWICNGAAATRHWGLRFSNCVLSGLTALSWELTGVWQMWSASTGPAFIEFLNCDFAPSYSTDPPVLFDPNGAGTLEEPIDLAMSFVDCHGTITTLVDSPTGCEFTERSVLTINNYDRTADDHRVWRAAANGWLQTDASVYNTAAPSEKMTPASASVKLKSSVKRFAVAQGATATVTVYVRKNAAYNGNAPRLIIKRNDTAGITADVVGDTHTEAADNWEQLTYTTSAVADNCVVEAYVDCDGTAGVVYVDDWAAS